jgi:glucokinase
MQKAQFYETIANSMRTFLGFDVGGTKTAWGLVDEEGVLIESGRYPTPTVRSDFIDMAAKLALQHTPRAIGIGIAGTLSRDKKSTLLCTNLPSFSKWTIVSDMAEATSLPVTVDNDARCALIGEVWKGSAHEMTSAVFITVGTGVGGAVMQKGRILPHPQDIGREISRIVADPTDVFPSKSGRGTIESLIGGLNLERRLDISLKEIATAVRQGDEEAIEIWKEISHFFIICLKAIHIEYSCKNIIVGGVGSHDLKYYLQDPPPCPTIVATLGENAALYGTARLAMDLYDDVTSTNWD